MASKEELLGLLAQWYERFGDEAGDFDGYDYGFVVETLRLIPHQDNLTLLKDQKTFKCLLCGAEIETTPNEEIEDDLDRDEDQVQQAFQHFDKCPKIQNEDGALREDLPKQRDTLLAACKAVRSNIDDFIHGGWESSEEGWRALSDRLTDAIAIAEGGA